MEDERVEADLQRMLVDESFQGFSHRHHSYRRRGQYAEQLARLLEHLPREQLHVVDSGDFFARPADEFARTLDFLGLSKQMPSSFGHWNARPGSGLEDGVRDCLQQDLKPHDDALTALLGAVPSWRRG